MKTLCLSIAGILLALSLNAVAGEPNSCGASSRCAKDFPCAECDSKGDCWCSTCCVAAKDRKPGWQKAEAGARAKAKAHAKAGVAAAAAEEGGEAACPTPKDCESDPSVIKPMAGEKPGTIHCDSCPVYCTRTICDLNSCWTERYICGWRACNCKGE